MRTGSSRIAPLLPPCRVPVSRGRAVQRPVVKELVKGGQRAGQRWSKRVNAGPKTSPIGGCGASGLMRTARQRSLRVTVDGSGHAEATSPLDYPPHTRRSAAADHRLARGGGGGGSTMRPQVFDQYLPI